MTHVIAFGIGPVASCLRPEPALHAWYRRLLTEVCFSTVDFHIQLIKDLYREHGTTMAGLKALGYDFDNDEFHALVHGTLPYHALKPDLVLRNLLLSMLQRKIIFTNADKAHVAQVLNRMCLEDCFEGLICFEIVNTHSVE